MGCGQSHIAVIYPRKAKGKSAGSGGGSEESDEEAQAGGEAATNPVAEESPPVSESEDESRMRIQISSSPLLAQAELSSSQTDFFRMLDEKINNGPDYDPSCEYEFAMDQAQLCRLLQEWQAAKLRSKCGLTGGPKLQRYHSLQSNGDIPQRKLHHQMSTYTPAQTHQQYHYPPPHQYQPHPYHQPPNQVSNLVVMYDKREGYCTKLA